MRSVYWESPIYKVSPSQKNVTKGILDYVHSDMWGSPSTPDILGRCKYFITFIDDYSKKVWLYFLKNKSDSFATFKEWKTAVKT